MVLFINHCIHISSVREAFTAASTAKILYQHTERIPEHPDDVEIKAVLKNIAVKNANMLLYTWGYEAFVEPRVCSH